MGMRIFSCVLGSYARLVRNKLKINEMKSYILFAVLFVAATVTGCGGHHHDHAANEGGHVHEENLQLTAYSDDFEVYAEATPFVAGEASDLLSHFTFLKNFKPLEAGKVTASLIVGTEKVSQVLEKPTRSGIYKFALTPKVAGKGKILFDIQTAAGTSQIIVPEITVFQDKHDAQHEAAKAVATSSNGVAFIKEMSWKVDFSTVPCLKEPFGQVIRTMAQVQPSQGDERVVTAKTSGIVVIPEVGLVDGKSVSAGQTLFHIESGEMADNNLTVRYREAESNYNLTKKEYERKRELAKDKIVSESDLLQAKANYETAEAVYNNLRKNFSAGRQSVTAPISGFVKQLLVRNGEYIEAGQPIVSVSQNRNLFIKAEIQPKYYPLLSNIADAKFRMLNDDAVYTLDDLNGRLVSYGKSVETNSPLLPVVFQVNNSAQLLPGSFVEMYIKTRGGQPVITVPNVSLVEEMGNYFVYVQLTPEYFEKREVKIGQTDGDRTEILSGLSEKERVVAKGAVLVKLAQATGSLDAESGHAH